VETAEFLGDAGISAEIGDSHRLPRVKQGVEGVVRVGEALLKVD